MRYGIVTYFSVGVLKLSGLQEACVGEVLFIKDLQEKVDAMVVQVLRDEFFWLFLGALILPSYMNNTPCAANNTMMDRSYSSICLGTLASSTSSILSIFIGNWLIGNVINIDGTNLFNSNLFSYNIERYRQGSLWLIETPAPSIILRKSVCEPLATGILGIDSIIPIGRGQRELIVGDRQTGKTSIGLDTILNQNGLGVFYFFAGIGQKATVILDLVLSLANRNSIGYVILCIASASGSAVSLFLSSYATSSIAEYFMWTKKASSFIFYDDLSKHAVAYRELSLLLRRPPGREAFPGEIFFIHSRLLERSAKLHFGLGGGSITAFPVLETLAGEISGYITTNVISITDGQIFLSLDFFLSNIRPAIDFGLSVTRVGSAAQTSSMKKVGGTFKIDLAQYYELQAFSQFASDIGADTQFRLSHGIRLVSLLTQFYGNPLSLREQIRLFSLSSQTFFISLKLDELKIISNLLFLLPEWLFILLSNKFCLGSISITA